MLKSTVGLLTLSFGLAATGSIVQFEQARSLGDGRLAAALGSKNHAVAVRAALAIGRTKQPAGVPLLLRHVHDGQTGMRAMAVYGLGLIGTAGGATAILTALDDRNGAVAVAALDATDRLETAHVFRTGQESAAAASVAHMLTAGNSAVRARAATTLESFNGTPQDGAAGAALTRAYANEQDRYVRWHIMWSLFRGYAKTAPVATLLSGLKDSDETVRIEAARALGRRGDSAQVAALQPLTDDPSWRVQEQAAESLTVLKGGKMSEHWTAIPAGVHTPAPVVDPFASLAALPRTPHTGKLRPPTAQAILTHPPLDPRTLEQFTGPAAGPHPRMRIVTTQGNITVELFPEWAPLTVENFINLANSGYYDGNPWFRIVPDFVVQSGDPSATAPGPGYTTVAEENPIEQDSYVISMGLDYTNPPNAHAKRDSAGSEFYITLSPQLHLDRDFTVFGKMIGGFDVLGRLVESDKIVRIERLPDSNAAGG